MPVNLDRYLFTQELNEFTKAIALSVSSSPTIDLCISSSTPADFIALAVRLQTVMDNLSYIAIGKMRKQRVVDSLAGRHAAADKEGDHIFVLVDRNEDATLAFAQPPLIAAIVVLRHIGIKSIDLIDKNRAAKPHLFLPAIDRFEKFSPH